MSNRVRSQGSERGDCLISSESDEQTWEAPRDGSARPCTSSLTATARMYCSGRAKTRTCDQPSVAQQVIEVQVLAALAAITPSDEMIRQAVETCERGDDADAALERQRLERQKRKLRELFLHTDDTQLLEYERRKGEIERQLELLEPVAEPGNVLAEVARYLSNLLAAYEDADHSTRNDLLSHLMIVVIIEHGTVTDVGLTPEADYAMRQAQTATVKGMSGAA